MRVLIPGGDGMLGHQLLRHFAREHDVRVTLRLAPGAYGQYGLFSPANAYYGIDVRAEHALAAVLADFRPHAVINAVGIVKQQPTASESIPSIAINSLFPHQLALLCADVGARLVHISTDCVFSGSRGNYRESDRTDPDDLYGMTKLLGEVRSANCLTLRTSIVGRELARKKSLLEWFLAQRGTVKGYRRAIYTGFTTREMARIIERILLRPAAAGIYHVSSDPISKYDLLCLVRDQLGLPVEVVPDDEVRMDRSLDSTRFRRDFDYIPPSWDAMIGELAAEIRAENKQ